MSASAPPPPRSLYSRATLVIGVVLAFCFTALSALNEWESIRSADANSEALRDVVSIAADAVNISNEGHLVHVTGLATGTRSLADPLFGVTVPSALSLSRQVLMFQWKEDVSPAVAGQKERTFGYQKMWSARVIDNTFFNRPGDHKNPTSMLASSETFPANPAMLGAFVLPRRWVETFDAQTDVDPSIDDLARIEPRWRSAARIIPGGFYIGTNPDAPEIGDQKILFKAAPPRTISLIAAQSGTSFEPYRAKSGESVELVRSGAVEASAMLTRTDQDSQLGAALFRVVFFLLLWFAIWLPLRLLAADPPATPFGAILGAGASIAAFALSLTIDLLATALVWSSVWPWRALCLAGAALVCILVAERWGRRRAALKTGSPT